MNTKIDLDSSEYRNLRREILRKVGFVKPLNQASENEADILYAEEYKKASGKIDTFFKKLNDADYKLQWIGIDKLNRDQLIDLVILFIGRQSKYKDIYNNLKLPTPKPPLKPHYTLTKRHLKNLFYCNSQRFTQIVWKT